MRRRTVDPEIVRHPWSDAAAAILVLMILIIWPGLELPGKTLRDALLLVAGPLLVALAMLGRHRRPPALLAAPLLAVFALGLAHIFLAPAAEAGAVSRALATFAAAWLVCLSAAMAFDTTHADAGNRLTLAAIVSLAVLSLIGLAQTWLGWQGLPQFAPPAGTFVNRNVAAQVLIVLIPPAAGAALLASTSFQRYAAAGAAGLGLAFLVATRSRGGWLGLAVGLTVGVAAIAVASRRHRLRPPAGAVGPLVLIAALAGTSLIAPAGDETAKRSVGGTLSTLTGVGDSSTEVRKAFWMNGLAMSGDAILSGYGPGRFPVVYPLYQQARRPTPRFGPMLQAEHPHNDTLELAIELGLPAALLVMGCLIGAVILSFRQAVRGKAAAGIVGPAVRAAALAGLLTHSMVSFPLHSPAGAYLAWLLVGCAFASNETGEAPSSLRRIVLAFAVALLLAGGWVGLREIRAQHALSRAVRAHAAKDCASAAGKAASARRLVPWNRRTVGMSAMVTFDCEPDPERSLLVLEPALARSPNDLNLLLAAGARRLKAGRPDDAAIAFRQALAVTPELGRAWLGLAMALDASGDRDAAAQACARAVEVDSALPQAQTYCRGNGYLPGP